MGWIIFLIALVSLAAGAAAGIIYERQTKDIIYRVSYSIRSKVSGNGVATGIVWLRLAKGGDLEPAVQAWVIKYDANWDLKIDPQLIVMHVDTE